MGRLLLATTPFSEFNKKLGTWMSKAVKRDPEYRNRYGVIVSPKFYKSLCDDLADLERFTASLPKANKPVTLGSIFTEWGFVNVRVDPDAKEEFVFYTDDGF